MLNSNLRQDNNFATFIPRNKGVSIHGFRIVTSSILIIFVILLENDVFKLSVYLDIHFFSCVSILTAEVMRHLYQGL